MDPQFFIRVFAPKVFVTAFSCYVNETKPGGHVEADTYSCQASWLGMEMILMKGQSGWDVRCCRRIASPVLDFLITVTKKRGGFGR